MEACTVGAFLTFEVPESELSFDRMRRFCKKEYSAESILEGIDAGSLSKDCICNDDQVAYEKAWKRKDWNAVSSLEWNNWLYPYCLAKDSGKRGVPSQSFLGGDKEQARAADLNERMASCQSACWDGACRMTEYLLYGEVTHRCSSLSL